MALFIHLLLIFLALSQPSYLQASEQVRASQEIEGKQLPMQNSVAHCSLPHLLFNQAMLPALVPLLTLHDLRQLRKTHSAILRATENKILWGIKRKPPEISIERMLYLEIEQANAAIQSIVEQHKDDPNLYMLLLERIHNKISPSRLNFSNARLGAEEIRFLLSYWKEVRSIVLPNRNKYIGEFKSGRRHGQGIFTWSDGNTYEGQWQDGRQHGQGKFIWSDGNTYEGQFRDGKQHGQGKYTWAYGDTYEGQWQDWQMHGHGKYSWSDGCTYEGQWLDNKRHGLGKYTWLDGSTYEGQWHNDRKRGPGFFKKKHGKAKK